MNPNRINDNQPLLVQWDMLENDELVKKSQHELKNNGIMVIENFATERGLLNLKEEILNLPYNTIRDRLMTPYLDQGDFTNYPVDHPRNLMISSSVAFIGRKTFESKSPDKFGVSLYNNNKLIEFFSKVAGRRLYRSNDENGSVYSYRIHADHRAPWHFDESPYTAIIYLENTGTSDNHDNCGSGSFEFIPWSRPTRSKDDVKGHKIVQKVLIEQNLEDVCRVPATPGTLVFFSGAHSFHRAAPILPPTDGEKEGLRLGLVFTFSDTEGFSNSDNVKNQNEWDPEQR